MGPSKSKPAGQPWSFLLVTFLAVLIVFSTGFSYYYYQRDQLRSLTKNDLTIVAELKVNQIENWLTERRNDAEMIHDNSIFFTPLFAWLAGERSPGLEGKIIRWMKSICGDIGYSGIALLDRRGNTKLYYLKTGESDFDYEPNKREAALKAHRIIFGDFHRDGKGAIKLDIYIPIQDHGTGLLVLRINPKLFLYPLIQTWPGSSETAETLLVRREGDEIIFLNELRHRKNTALNLQLPLNTPLLPAALTIKGNTGLIMGQDYRGHKVLAVGRPIPGTGWFIVAKIDESEIFLSMIWIGVRASAFGALIIVLLGAGLYFQISRRSEAELRASKDAFEQLVSASPDAVIATDPEGRISYLSEEALKLNGVRSGKELIGRSIFDRIAANDKEKARNTFQETMESGLTKNRAYTFMRPDGSLFIGELSAALTRNNRGRTGGFIVTVKDVTTQRAMERVIRESAVKFEALFDKMSSGVIIYQYRKNDTDDFIISDINRAVERIEKVKREEVIGRNVLDVFPGNKASGIYDALLRVNGTGQPEHLPAIAYQDQRISGWRENYLYKLPTGEIVTVYDDITERKQAEYALSVQNYHLQKSQELALIGSWDLDLQSKVLTWTDETYKIFGVPAGTPMTYDKFLNLVFPDDREHVDKAWQAALVHHDYDLEHRVLVNGEVRWVREKAELQFDEQGRAVRGIGAVLDITEYKHLVNLRDDFVNTVSHELRTPMAIIHEGVAQVLEGFHGPVTEEQKRFLATTERSIDRLGRIINNLLDISRLEAGKMEAKKDEVDFAQLVRETAAAFRLPAQKKGLELAEHIPDGPLTICADRDELIEVITNLLGNALKFTDKGRIEISVSDHGHEVECSVSDTGRGLPADKLPKLFEKFTQFGRVAGAGEKGTGLGLAIAKALVELHDGHIRVESTEHAGSTFTFTLPKS